MIAIRTCCLKPPILADDRLYNGRKWCDANSPADEHGMVCGKCASTRGPVRSLNVNLKKKSDLSGVCTGHLCKTF